MFSFAFNTYANISQFPAPTNLNTTDIQSGNATLSWINDTNSFVWIVNYNISQSNYIEEYIVSENSLIITDLVLGTTYNWKVRMIDIYGDTTNWSNIATFITSSESLYCNPISYLTIDAMGPSGITIQWNADSNQNQWEVVYGTLGSDPNLEGAREVINDYFHIIPASDLIIGNWYQIAVRNICIGEESGWSFISTRYISNQYYDLPVQQTFEDDLQNSRFGFVNGTLNPWVLKTSYNITVDGNKSIYVSTNGGYTNDYYPLSPAISYAYIDVLIPDYASSFYLDFKWNCLGEAANDGLKVYLMGENTPLSTYELPNSVNEIGNIFYNNSMDQWQSEHIEIPAQFVGQVRRLVFAWVNNSSIGGQGAAIIDDIYITARYCAPPTNPSHSYVSSTYANISWDFAEGQNIFNVQYRKIGATAWNQINSVTSNHILQDLDDNTTYIYRVQADCGMEESFFSPIDTFTTLIRCLPPENIHTTEYSNNHAILLWNESPDVSNWILEYGVNEGENTIYNTKNIYSRFDTLTNLTPDTDYSIRIKAISIHNDTSRYSYFLLHTLCNTIDVFPFNDLEESIAWNYRLGYNNPNSCWETKGDTLFSPIFDFSNLGYPELSFNYSHFDSVFPFLYTKLLATNNGISFYEIMNLTQNQNLTSIIEDIPQFANESYIRFAFVPKCYDNSITNYNIRDFQIREVCKSPEEISIIEITSNNATIDWARYSNNSNWDIVVTDTLMGSSENYTTASLPFQIPNLEPDRVYRIWVKSYCGINSDEQWTKTIIRTNIEPGCRTPSNFEVRLENIEDGYGAVTCSWDAEEASIWELEYKEAYAVDWERVRVFNNPRHTLRNLFHEPEYMFRVRTLCGIDDYSDWTSIIHLSFNSLEDEIDFNSLIKIYPNPTSGIINIETSRNDIIQTKLINLNGQIIKVWDYLPREIYLSNLNSGAYYLQINTSKRKINKKIIIIK